MTTMRDLDPTAAAVRADEFDQTAAAVRADEFDRTTFAPRGDDATSAWAWASSPLGEPSDHAGDLSDQAGDLPYGYDLPTELITPAATRKPIDKLIVGAGLIGLIGAGTALGIALLSGSPQSQRSTAVRASSDAPRIRPRMRSAFMLECFPWLGPMPTVEKRFSSSLLSKPS